MNQSRTIRPFRLLRRLPALFACLLLLPSTQDAAGQDARPRRSEVTINVQMKGEMCVYNIADYPDQDVFRISPGGKVTFNAVGTAASFEIARQNDTERPDHPNNGKNGVDNREDRAFELAAGGNRTVTATSSNVGKSTHKIWILCLVNGAELVSESGPAADGASGATQWIPAIPETQLNAANAGGDKVGQEDNPQTEDAARASGGPGMEIDPDE